MALRRGPCFPRSHAGPLQKVRGRARREGTHPAGSSVPCTSDRAALAPSGHSTPDATVPGVLFQAAPKCRTAGRQLQEPREGHAPCVPLQMALLGASAPTERSEGRQGSLLRPASAGFAFLQGAHPNSCHRVASLCDF